MNNNLHKSTLKKIENQKKVEETLKRFEDDKTLFLRKISMVSGNVRKDSGGIIQSYKGVYGVGWTIDVPYWNPNGKGSGRYHQRYYYIYKKNSDG